MVSCSQAARQAAQENKKEVKEVTQTAAPPPAAATSAAEVPSHPTVKKLPVGSTVSSVHVDYNYFEVGTGQVNTSVCQQQWAAILKQSWLTFNQSSAGVCHLPHSGLWACEFLCLGFSNRHVPDCTRTWEDRRGIPAAHMQGILQYLSSSMCLCNMFYCFWVRFVRYSGVHGHFIH